MAQYDSYASNTKKELENGSKKGREMCGGRSQRSYSTEAVLNRRHQAAPGICRPRTIPPPNPSTGITGWRGWEHWEIVFLPLSLYIF